MGYGPVAERLTNALALDTPPVALTFTDSPPQGVADPDRAVAGACAFWRMAEKGVFYAPPAAHHTCGVGSMTLGFTITKGVQEELNDLRQRGMFAMPCGADQVEVNEADLPDAADLEEPGVLYGPLADFPIMPDVVLIWLTPRHAMTFTKVSNLSGWANDPVLVPPTSPPCSGVPIARSSETATLTLGCAGLRTYAEVTEDRMLGTLPGNIIETITDDFERIIAEFDATVEYCEGQVEKFAAIDEEQKASTDA